eukprot:8907730-Pyramimonas_sp.AAC.1
MFTNVAQAFSSSEGVKNVCGAHRNTQTAPVRSADYGYNKSYHNMREDCAVRSERLRYKDLDGSLGCCVHPCRYWHRRTLQGFRVLGFSGFRVLGFKPLPPRAPRPPPSGSRTHS